MGDDHIVISSGQVVTPETVMSRNFTSAFRGYHPVEVRQFLKRVSDEIAAAEGRETELRRALQEALERAAHPQLDEATLTNLLGEHAAKLLASARDTAASIVGEGRHQADAVLRDAEQRMARMREEAEGLMARRVAEADATAASIHQAARAEAQAQIENATQQGKDMVAEARAVRERMLGDLARRRRTAQVQVEQLRAARERLLAAYDVVRRTVEEATAELEASEPEARMAAEAVALRAEESAALRATESTALRATESTALRATESTALRATESTAPRATEVAAPRVELRPPATPAPEPEPAMSLVAGAPAPPVREQRRAPVPSSALFRKFEEKPPPGTDRPRLRPQTVADAVAGRMPPAPPTPQRPSSDIPPVPTAAAAPPTVAPPPPPEAPVTAAPAPVIAAPSPALPPDPPVVSGTPIGSSSTSELATGEVPAITGDAPLKDVESLFARLRAGRDAPDLAEPLPELDEPLTGLFDPDPAPPQPEPLPVDAVSGENALEGRDDLLDNLEAGITRALKRVLGDEQNEVLDSLRRLGLASGDDVLPEVDSQIARYRDAALPWLQQAARAGVGFVSDPASGSDAEIAHPTLDAQAQALACELVQPLRERLSRALSDGPETDDPSAVGESLRATYRQWKVQQVEQCARHHVVVAFSLGAFTATPDATVLQWLVDDDGHCPDCDDNALAGPTPKGQPFPTGQLHPPAHPGCRCLLVPVTASVIH